MPKRTFITLPEAEHAQMLAARRCARYGTLLALHLLWGCAAGRTPTAIAPVLCCARASVDRTVPASRAGTLGWAPDDEGRLSPPVRTTGLVPTRRRALWAWLKASPRAAGGCRTRWSGAARALTRQATRGLSVSAETMRRWGHAVGWVWTRATWVANDDAPRRVDRLARMRSVFEPLKPGAALVCAAARQLHRWPNVGGAWRPTGTPRAVMTPGPHQQPSLAGARALTTGTRHHGRGPRTPNARCRDLRPGLEARVAAAREPRLSGGVDHDHSQQAKAVEDWLAAHPRCPLRWWPSSWPRAHPMARAVGDVHDGGTRHPQRHHRPHLVTDVAAHLPRHGPWKSRLAALAYEPAVTAAVDTTVAAAQAQAAA